MSKLSLTAVAGSALLAWTLTAGCANPLGVIVGSTTVVCDVPSDAGAASCTANRNFPSSEQSSLVNECTNQGGKIVTSCPTSELLGCCTITSSEISIESCYYQGAGTVSQLRSDCGTGTWSTTP